MPTKEQVDSLIKLHKDARLRREAETHGFKDATVVFKSSMGFGLTVLHCRELVIEHRPYAQYKRGTWVTFKLPRKRKHRQAVLGHDQVLAVFDGKGIEYSNFKPADACGSSEGKYASCDPGWNDELEALVEKYRLRLLYSQDERGAERRAAQ